MSQKTDEETISVTPTKTSRSLRSLLTVLAVLLIPILLGLGYLLFEFLNSTERTNDEHAAATARDTLVLSAYDRALELFYVTQEAYLHPRRTGALAIPYKRLLRSLDSLSVTYRALLAQAPDEVRSLLNARFDVFYGSIDTLFRRSAQVFDATYAESVRRSGRWQARSSSSAPEPTFLQDANTYFRGLRLRLDDLLRAELAEDMIQVRNARRYIDRITYRGFLIAFVLLGIGVTLAVVLLKRGKEFEERTRRYQTLLAYSVNPIQVVDKFGRTRYVNPSFEQWSGVSASEVVGRPAFEGISLLEQRESERDFWSVVSPSLLSGGAWSGDVEFRKRDGDRAFTMLIISPVFDTAGGVLECIAIHHDITERMELGRKFEESQEKYHDIVESSLDGIVIIQNERLVFANPSAAKIFGYGSEDEMKQLNFSDTLAPSSRFISIEGTQNRPLGEDLLRNVEIKGLTKQGKVVDLEMNARIVAWNGGPAVQASFRDITERKVMERELALWLWEQETLSTIDRQLVASVDLQTVLNAICFQAKTLTRSDWTGVMMADLATNRVRWRAAKGNQIPLSDEPFQPGQAQWGIIRMREPYVLRDFSSSPEFPVEELPPFKDEHIVSAARFPLIVDGEVRGQLVVGYRRHHDFLPREVRLLNSLAEKSSIALANAQLYDNLLERERELELLSGARIRAQEEERRRIAREIHDSLGQMLTAIKFNVEILEDAAALQDGESVRRMGDIKSLLDNAMAEAREISYNLMPSVLVDFGLVPALEYLCDQFSRRNNLKANVRTRGVDSRLDPTVEIGLYRITQEALTNVAKHAGAREVTVQLLGSQESIRLMIEDDGRGFSMHRFDPRSGKRHGLGLVSMRERAASFGGTFTLDSSPGRGTEVIIEIPLRDTLENG